MPKMSNLASLDFYIKNIPAHVAGTWETNEIELPSDVDVESEALVLYGIEAVIQDSATVFADGSEFVFPFNFHLVVPLNEQDLDTCFMSKVIHGLRDAGLTSLFNEGNISPMVPIVVITSFHMSANTVADAIAADDLAFRIWYDDVPLAKDKMAALVNILRGEQV